MDFTSVNISGFCFDSLSLLGRVYSIAEFLAMFSLQIQNALFLAGKFLHYSMLL
jgi:hypothetical protein